MSTKRKRPTPTGNRPSPKHRANGYPQSTAEAPRYGIDGYPLDDKQRRDAHLTAIAYAAGYRLAVRCARCGQWLVAEKSVRLHLGPVCAAKLGEQVVA